ncbi:hypothetical protein TanjilG_30719 [Lupinus angustifolius]|uniref:Protein kinase domain-containing protein n=1 Tax=Lupinus angustifolius TaxID=3871 RepID=A0A4P1RP03_LUPAN|nr:hypothetical protein TanjilG_30719 [Lupinus angustifolius]
MAKQVIATPPAPFDYVLLDGDAEHPITVRASSSNVEPWIEPEMSKLRHRICRGPLGDVWLATHHQSTEDYGEYHEVAAKMLPPLREDHMKTVLEKFHELYFQLQGVAMACCLHGFSIMNGRVKFGLCILFAMWEIFIFQYDMFTGCRYGINLAQGIQELHSKGVLILNLKPFNVLLTDNDQTILGDFGIPNILLGSSFLSSDMPNSLGTPNYMAPEQ